MLERKTKIMKEKISVVIPIFRVEKYIEKCLNSLLNQTYKNIEIICVGDKGVENDISLDIAKKKAKTNKNIKVYLQDKRGVGSARNFGFTKSTGKFIMFVDSDDYVEKNMIELMYNRLTQTKSDIVVCGFDRIDEITEKIYSREMISMDYNILKLNHSNMNEMAFTSPSPWGKLYKRELIENIKFSDNKDDIEDLLYFLYLVPNIKRIAYLKNVLYHYLVREGSAVLTTSSKKSQTFRNSLIKVKNYYTEKKLNAEYMYFLDIVAFIHVGISVPHRISNNKEEKLSLHLKEAKKYFDINFPNWKKIRLKQTKKIGIKNLAIYMIKILYRLNCVVIFFYLYNFMIKYLKIDVKW